MTHSQYSKADLQRMAKIVQEAGSADGDTMLIHVTKEEAAVLKARGGAGTPDPRTGLLHYNTDTSTDGSEGKDQGPDGGKSSRDNDKNNREASERADSVNAQDKAARDANSNRDALLGAFGKGDPNEIANRTADQIGGKGNYGTAPGQADLSKDVQPGEQYGGMRKASGKGWLAGISAGVGTLALTGTPSLALAAGKKVKDLATSDGTGWDIDNGQQATPRGLTESKGGNNAPAPKAPVNSTPAPVTPAAPAPPVFDEFVGKARKRKGYLSTVLGGKVPAGSPQGKKLLGE